MSRKIRIVTSSFATLEDTRPPYNLRHPTPEENLRTAQLILETASAYKPDLVLLPEAFLLAGMPLSKVKDIAEPIPGPTFEVLASSCCSGNFNLVAGHVTRENGRYYNQALVIDRSGRLVAFENHHIGAQLSQELPCGRRDSLWRGARSPACIVRP